VTPESLKAALSTPSISSDGTNAKSPPSTAYKTTIGVAGSRAAEAFIRPAPIVTAGDLEQHGFDLKNCTFHLAHTSTTLSQLPTEIYLPAYHFPRDNIKVSVSSGHWVIGDDENGVQILKWWCEGKGPQKIEVTGTKLKHLEAALDDDSYIGMYGRACEVM
jgi:hypothetical protein